MKGVGVLAALALQAAQGPAPDLSQECQIETVTLCDQAGCRGVEPTLKIYLGEYAAEDGKHRGYYYRCRRADLCDIIENPWIGENGGYRAFVARERGVIAKIGPENRITDIATIEDRVLILRGRCWDTPRPSVTRDGKLTAE